MTYHGLRPLLAVFLGLLLSHSALGQARMQFPSLLGDGTTVPPPGTAGTGVSTFTPAQGTAVQPNSAVAPPVYGAPQASGATPYPAAPNYAVPPNYTAPPTYSQPGTFGQPGATVNPLAPSLGPQTAPVGPVPGAQFSGTIQAPPATWDPYAPPGSAPASLLPQDPYLPYNTPAFSTGNIQRFLQEARLDYVWMVGHGEKEFGINDIETYATFAIPFFHNTQTPLLVTPGFAVHLWEGPVTVPPTEMGDLPPVAYDAYLEGAWNPQVTQTFGGELSFRTGVYSDFKHINEHSIRYQGKGLAVLAFSPNVKVKAGVWYIDRNKIKILPAGGLIWTPQGPDGNVVFEILFPNPRIAFRLADYQNTEWWLYGRGEYGGGAWAVTRLDGPDRVDYNDIRVAVGLEFIRPRFSGLFEVGGAFEREIIYHSGTPPATYPHPTVFLRGSVAF
ncbi:MAG: hypothetical protein RBS80_01065 [Thermoguttaceae bacterium]|nr:hypothetical protein [Thermoguttaceae bacterium]